MKAPWERGRPARTNPGTASVISTTWINRERRPGSPSAWPLLFPPTGWLPAASHGSSAAAKGTGCGRDARAPRRCRPGGAVGGVWRATSQNADLHPLGNSRLPASRAPGLAGGSFQEKRPIVIEDEPPINTNQHESTRIDQNTDGPPSTTSGAEMLPQFCPVDLTMSRDEGPPGARASRPHQAWHSLGHLHDLDQPGTAPWLDAVPSNRVEHRIEA